MEPFGQAVLATDGALGFDCDVTLSAVDVMAFAAAGFTWVARYLSHGAQARHDLQAVEVRTIHMVGLAVLPIQHVAIAPWVPSATLGTQLGQAAQKNASGIGCPPGVVLWLDLEGVAASSAPGQVAAFCNAWDDAVRVAGFDSGLYIGANAGLSGNEAYHLLSTRRYWRSLSGSVPPVAVRGYQIVQSAGSTMSGVTFDRDVIARDNFGDLPVVWAP